MQRCRRHRDQARPSLIEALAGLDDGTAWHSCGPVVQRAPRPGQRQLMSGGEVMNCPFGRRSTSITSSRWLVGSTASDTAGRPDSGPHRRGGSSRSSWIQLQPGCLWTVTQLGMHIDMPGWGRPQVLLHDT